MRAMDVTGAAATSRARGRSGGVATRLAALFAVERLEARALLAAAGDLDNAFSGDGIAIFNHSGFSVESGDAVAVQADGKVVVAGATGSGSASGDVLLLRYKTDGTLDDTFDGDGKVITDLPTNVRIDAVAIGADGKILVGGAIDQASTWDWFLARYNANGTPDNTFDTDGYLTRDFFNLGYGDELHAISVQADGKILATGVATGPSTSEMATVRFNTNGSLDTTFDGDGVAIMDFFGGVDYASDVLAQSDGKILVVGGSVPSGGYRQFVLVRYNANGTPDTTFDGDGKASTNFGVSAFAREVARQSDGKYVVGGLVGTDGSAMNWAVARYNANGSIDTTFGAGGTNSVPGSTVLPDVHGHVFLGYGIAVQADDKIVFGGDVEDPASTNSYTGVVRYNANGTLDATFGAGGKRITDVGAVSGGFSGTSAGADLALAPDGKILVSGNDYRSGSSGDLTVLRYHAVSVAEPTGTASLSSGVLTVTGTSGPDVVSLAYSGGTFTATVNGTPFSFTDPVGSISVSLLAGADVLNLNGGVPGGSVDLGDGADSVSLSAANGPGTVTVVGGAGNDTLTRATGAVLNVNFNGGADTDTLTYNAAATGTETTVTTSGVTDATAGTITYAALESLTVNAGDGNDTVKLDSATVPVTVNGGLGNDSLYLAYAGGNLASVSAPVTYAGGDGTADLLWLFDDLVGLGSTYSIAANTVSRSGFGGASHSATESVFLYGQSNANTFNVTSTAAATRYSLSGFGGNDTYNVGTGNLDALVGRVDIDGGSGTDLITLNDAGVSFNDNYTINSTQVLRVVFGGLTYQAVEGVTLNAQSGNNPVTLSSTAAGTPVTINGNDGHDTLTISAAPSSAVTFNGGTAPFFTDTLNVNAGTYAFAADARNGTANLALNVGAAGAVTFGPSQHLKSLAIAGGGSVAISGVLGGSGARVIVTETLSIAAGGTLNLANNDLIVRAGAADAVSAHIAAGRIVGTASPTGVARLGVSPAADALHITSSQTGTFSGETVTGAAVLVGYTYTGDADLNGRVDGDDYFVIDANINVANAWGWWHGNFNLDAKINGDDYWLIDSTIGRQGVAP
ncbi:MAG TPA: hypothetical protein VER17_15760 [Tepidisphaeraceae bacterium]|nr:hypothetical protein [Tepidisphaeraceae bacterium]